MTTKKTRSVRTIILPAVSRRDHCYASENEGFCFYQIPPSPSTFAVDSHELHEPYKPLESNCTNRSNRTNRNRTNWDAPRTALNRNEPRTPCHLVTTMICLQLLLASSTIRREGKTERERERERCFPKTKEWEGRACECRVF